MGTEEDAKESWQRNEGKHREEGEVLKDVKGWRYAPVSRVVLVLLRLGERDRTLTFSNCPQSTSRRWSEGLGPGIESSSGIRRTRTVSHLISSFRPRCRSRTSLFCRFPDPQEETASISFEWHISFSTVSPFQSKLVRRVFPTPGVGRIFR